jgi:hypothetical protein
MHTYNYGETSFHMQQFSGRKFNILGGYSVGHCKQKEIYVYMCSVPNASRDRGILLYRRATRRIAQCTDVDVEIFYNVLHSVNCTSFAT